MVYKIIPNFVPMSLAKVIISNVHVQKLKHDDFEDLENSVLPIHLGFKL